MDEAGIAHLGVEEAWVLAQGGIHLALGGEVRIRRELDLAQIERVAGVAHIKGGAAPY